MTITTIGYKSNTLDTSKVDTVAASSTPTDATAAAVGDLIPDVPGSTSSEAAVAASPFDDYLCGDTKGGVIDNATANDPGILSFLKDFPPTLDTILTANEKAIQYLDIVKGRYEQATSDLASLRAQLQDALFTGSVTAGESVAIRAKIEAIDVAMARTETELQKVNQKIETDGNMFVEELRAGKDLNGDAWIGRPGMDGSYGIKTLEDGRVIYIDPVTKTALDHPPYSDPDYQGVLAKGNITLAGEDVALIEGQQTVDATLQITSGEPLADSKFGTAYELCGLQYIWVERDGTSFDPKLDFQNEYAASEEGDVGTEHHYKISGFETVDGQIVQKTPADMGEYMQVEVAETRVMSVAVDGGKGYDHFIEYLDKDGTLIARVRVTGYDSATPLAYGRQIESVAGSNGNEIITNVIKEAIENLDIGYDGSQELTDEELAYFRGRFTNDREDHICEKIIADAFAAAGLTDPPSASEIIDLAETVVTGGTVSGYDEVAGIGTGPCRVYASTLGFAFNTDNVYSSAMKYDFSGVKSTGRQLIPDIEQKLGLTAPDGSNEQQKQAYEENMGLFRDEDYTMNTWGWTPIRTEKNGDSMGAAYDHNGRQGKYHWEQHTRDFEYGSSNVAYIDPTSDAARAETFFVNPPDRNDLSHPWSETIATPLTGVMVYGIGTRGHIIGSNYNDIIEVADVNALYKSDYYQEHYPYAEPIERSSALYSTVVEAGSGNNIVRAYGGDNYISGATFAWIDGNPGDLNVIATQGAEGDSSPTANLDDAGNAIQPVNPKNYVHVKAPGGEVAIHNPNEEVASFVEDPQATLGHGGSGGPSVEKPDWSLGTYDDFYDLDAGQVSFTHNQDHDAIESVGEGMLTANSTVAYQDDIVGATENAATKIWEEIVKVEIPDDVQVYVDEWMQLSGHSAEMQTEMNDFFGAMFGETDDLAAEFADAQNGVNSSSTATKTF